MNTSDSGRNNNRKNSRRANERYAMPPCPIELAPAAQAEWARVLIEYTEYELFKSLDLAVLAIYCNALSSWLAATADIQKYGAVVKAPSGYPMQSPFVSIAKEQANIIMRCAGELGLTPASRNKIIQDRKRTTWEGDEANGIQM